MKTWQSRLLLIFKKTDKVFDWISRVCAFCCGILLVGVTFMICAGVINRTFTTFVWLFVEEWASLALIPISYLAFAYTLRQGRHLRMDLIVRKLSSKAQNILAIFSAVFSFVCLIYMIQFALDRMQYTVVRSTTSSGPMQTPLAPFAACIVFGVCLFTIDMLFFLISRILELRQKEGENAS